MAEAAQSQDVISGRLWLGFAAMCFGMFMAVLDIQVVASSLAAIQGALHIPLERLAKSHQVHGTDVLVVEKPGSSEKYDAQITNKPDVFLVASIADCTPVLIYDPVHKAVAAVHAGWRGTVGGIVSKTLAKMHEAYGTLGSDCKAFIGACISYKNFEVGDDVAQHFDAALKRFDPGKQKWFVDLKAANKAQLLAAGLKPEHIEVSDYCTVENNDLFFSHRKEKGRTGRMMAVIGMPAVSR